MKKDKSLKSSITYLIIGYLIAQQPPAYGGGSVYGHWEDKDYVLDFVRVDPDFLKHHSEPLDGSPGLNVITVDILTENGPLPFNCYGSYKPNAFPSWELPDKTPAEQYKYYEYAAYQINSCTNYEVGWGAYNYTQVYGWRLWVRDGHGEWGLYVTGDDMNVGQPPPLPTDCTTQITEPLHFSIMAGVGPYRSETELYVKCEQNTPFDVTVNGSREFIDSHTGARITFEDFSTGSLALDCKGGCTFPLTGEMTEAPSKPGKYQWAVPVVIDFK